MKWVISSSSKKNYLKNYYNLVETALQKSSLFFFFFLQQKGLRFLIGMYLHPPVDPSLQEPFYKSKNHIHII